MFVQITFHSRKKENTMLNKLPTTKLKPVTKATSELIVNMGESWYKAFEQEFSKEYFQKVSIITNFIN